MTFTCRRVSPKVRSIEVGVVVSLLGHTARQQQLAELRTGAPHHPQPPRQRCCHRHVQRPGLVTEARTTDHQHHQRVPVATGRAGRRTGHRRGRLGYRRDRGLEVAHSQRLGHQVGVTASSPPWPPTRASGAVEAPCWPSGGRSDAAATAGGSTARRSTSSWSTTVGWSRWTGWPPSWPPTRTWPPPPISPRRSCSGCRPPAGRPPSAKLSPARPDGALSGSWW
jgi:hypothetical protein